jgi:hypothetical protein
MYIRGITLNPGGYYVHFNVSLPKYINIEHFDLNGEWDGWTIKAYGTYGPTILGVTKFIKGDIFSCTRQAFKTRNEIRNALTQFNPKKHYRYDRF